MSKAIIGFNTAAIKYEERFMALALKVETPDHQFETYYLQAPIVLDLLMALQNRMGIIARRVAEQGDSYKEQLVAANEALVKNVPQFEMAEVNQPDPNKRIMTLVLKAKEGNFALTAIQQDEQVANLHIDDMHAEFLMTAVLQSLKATGDEEAFQQVAALLDFIVLYNVDLSDLNKMDYQQILHEGWKQRLFSHHLGVLYCFETEEGKKVLSGIIVKTNAAHHSEEEKNIVQKIALLNTGLKTLREKYTLCQIFSTVIPAQPDKILTMEECLRPLHAFCVDIQAKLNAQ